MDAREKTAIGADDGLSENRYWSWASMARGRFKWFALMFAAIVLMAGCGAGEDKSSGDITAATSTGGNVAADADITSGCWSAADRGASDAERTEGSVAHQQWSKAPEMVIDTDKTYRATLDTSAGTVEVEFFPKDAPQTVNNFVCLARAGYFDGTPFHRIVQGFVAQGGDPTGTGSGGPGYRFADEPIPANRNYTKGTLAMANSGANTNGSQFFICTADLSGRLPKNYNIFGQVINGMDVVDALDKTPTQVRNGEKSSPVNPVTLNKVTITEA